jgi:hypothetical protein
MHEPADVFPLRVEGRMFWWIWNDWGWVIKFGT